MKDREWWAKTFGGRMPVTHFGKPNEVAVLCGLREVPLSSSDWRGVTCARCLKRRKHGK